MICVFSDFHLTLINSVTTLDENPQKWELGLTGEGALTFCGDSPAADCGVAGCYGYVRGLLSRAGIVTAVAVSEALNPCKLL